MEATCDGRLVRQFGHPGPNMRIRAINGRLCSIQRLKPGPHDTHDVLYCPSRFVSKRHCEISRRNRTYYIKDVGSTNGTFLNGVNIEKTERELRFNDTIGLGVSHLQPANSSEVDLELSDYYIYKFVKDEVVDLEDDDNQVEMKPALKIDPPKKRDTVKGNKNDSGNGHQVKNENKTKRVVEDASSIPKVKPGSSNQAPSTVTHGSGATERTKVAQVDNTKNTASNKISLKNANGGIHDKNHKSNKRMFQEPAQKKMKHESESSSSSDDSSDGLGDVDAPKRPAATNSSCAPDAYSVMSGDDSNTNSDAGDDNGSLQPSPGAVWTNIALPKRGRLQSSSDSDDNVQEPSFKSTNRKRKFPQQKIGVTARKSTCPSPTKKKPQDEVVDLEDDDDQMEMKPALKIELPKKGNTVKENKNNAKVKPGSSNQPPSTVIHGKDKIIQLKKKALRSTCRVKLERVLTMENENVLVSNKARKSLLPRVLTSITRQFLESLKRNQRGLERQPLGQESDSITLPRDKIKQIDKAGQINGNEKPDPKPQFKRIREISESSSTNESVLSKSLNNSDHNDEIELIDFEEVFDEDQPIPTVSTTVKPPPPKSNQGVSLPATKPSNRKIQVIDDAPTPRFANIAKAKAAAKRVLEPSLRKKPDLKGVDKYRNPEVVNTNKGQFITEEEKNLRSQKLKELELKKQEEKQKHEETKTSNDRNNKPVAKIKFTKRNRNQELMEDIAGKSFMDTQSVVGGFNDDDEVEHMEEDVILEETIPNQHTKSTEDTAILSDPRLLRRKVEEDINKSIATSALASSSKSRMPAPPPPPSFRRPDPVIGGNGVSNTKINLLKPGARVKVSPDRGIGRVAFREEAKLVAKPTTSRNRSILPTRPQLPEDEIYKRLCSWRCGWIQEQKRMNEQPPPVAEGLSITSTLTSYENFEAYFKTYYPLLLFEIWGTINKEIEGRSRHSEEKGNPMALRQTEYKIKIDDVKRPGYCGLIKHKMPVGRDHFPDESWVTLSYHAWTKTTTEIDIRKDYVQITFMTTEKRSNKKESKTVFAFAEPSQGRYEPIDDHVRDCDQRLKRKGEGKGTGKGYRFMETLVFKLGSQHSIDKESLGEIHRLLYIMPKIREFRALNDLPSLKLFQQIVSPPSEIPNRWTSPQKGLVKTKIFDMISYCRELNMEQQSMVDYVSSRIYTTDPELMLMHGPPGTGKTKTLIALVLQILVTHAKKHPASENNRILICTPSNAAIDEIMRRLITAVDQLPNNVKKLRIVRVGEGYSKELENYSVNGRVRCKDEEESTTKSLRVELAAVDQEIEEVEEELKNLKTNQADPIKISAKSSQRQELIAKRRALKQDLNPSFSRRDVKDIDNKRHSVIREANIICSTLSASGNSLMKNAFAKTMCGYAGGNKPFLCCIVDEASQTTEPETLLPLVLNIDKLVLVGDPLQLGATVLSQVAADKGYGQSMFTRLYKFYNRRSTNPIMMLTRQYRMHKEIVSWPNSYFYEGRLTTTYHRVTPFPFRPYYFLNLSVGREISKGEGHIENEDEKILVHSLLKSLEEILSATKQSCSVGIITPYAAQRTGIRNDIKSKTYKCLESIEVDTVDGFQGQEKDIIILSCVRTDGTGFLKSKNRLNVALTRAKHGLYIVGDGKCLSQDDMWRCLIQDAASRNCKYEVKSDFKMDLRLLQNDLITKLKENVRD